MLYPSILGISSDVEGVAVMCSWSYWVYKNRKKRWSGGGKKGGNPSRMSNKPNSMFSSLASPLPCKGKELARFVLGFVLFSKLQIRIFQLILLFQNYNLLMEELCQPVANSAINHSSLLCIEVPVCAPALKWVTRRWSKPIVCQVLLGEEKQHLFWPMGFNTEGLMCKPT